VPDTVDSVTQRHIKLQQGARINQRDSPACLDATYPRNGHASVPDTVDSVTQRHQSSNEDRCTLTIGTPRPSIEEGKKKKKEKITARRPRALAPVNNVNANQRDTARPRLQQVFRRYTEQQRPAQAGEVMPREHRSIGAHRFWPYSSRKRRSGYPTFYAQVIRQPALLRARTHTHYANQLLLRAHASATTHICSHRAARSSPISTNSHGRN